MPRSTLQHVAIDHVTALADLAMLVSELVNSPPGPGMNEVAAEIAELEGDKLGAAADIVCRSGPRFEHSRRARAWPAASRPAARVTKCAGGSPRRKRPSSIKR